MLQVMGSLIMDIRNWPLSQIMQLPDAAFGRRWPVGLAYAFAGAGAEFDISEAALPERFVIWEVLSTNQ